MERNLGRGTTVCLTLSLKAMQFLGGICILIYHCSYFLCKTSHTTFNLIFSWHLIVIPSLFFSFVLKFFRIKANTKCLSTLNLPNFLIFFYSPLSLFLVCGNESEIEGYKSRGYGALVSLKWLFTLFLK